MKPIVSELNFFLVLIDCLDFSQIAPITIFGKQQIIKKSLNLKFNPYNLNLLLIVCQQCGFVLCFRFEFL